MQPEEGWLRVLQILPTDDGQTRVANGFNFRTRPGVYLYASISDLKVSYPDFWVWEEKGKAVSRGRMGAASEGEETPNRQHEAYLCDGTKGLTKKEHWDLKVIVVAISNLSRQGDRLKSGGL